jgi:hypothetical protein
MGMSVSRRTAALITMVVIVAAGVAVFLRSARRTGLQYRGRLQSRQPNGSRGSRRQFANLRQADNRRAHAGRL